MERNEARMIFNDAFEFTCSSGREYGIEVTVDQYSEYLTDNGESSLFTDVLEIKIFDHFGDEVSQDMNNEDKDEIEEYAHNKEYTNEIE
jgi:hypothetical protein